MIIIGDLWESKRYCMTGYDEISKGGRWTNHREIIKIMEKLDNDRYKIIRGSSDCVKQHSTEKDVAPVFICVHTGEYIKENYEQMSGVGERIEEYKKENLTPEQQGRIDMGQQATILKVKPFYGNEAPKCGRCGNNMPWAGPDRPVMMDGIYCCQKCGWTQW